MGKGRSRMAGSKRMLAQHIGQSEVPAVPVPAVVVVVTRQQRRYEAAQAAKGALAVHPDQVDATDGDMDGVTLVRVRPGQKNAPAKPLSVRGRGKTKGVPPAVDDTAGGKS